MRLTKYGSEEDIVERILALLLVMIIDLETAEKDKVKQRRNERNLPGSEGEIVERMRKENPSTHSLLGQLC
jgi:hypothetical protein